MMRQKNQLIKLMSYLTVMVLMVSTLSTNIFALGDIVINVDREVSPDGGIVVTGQDIEITYTITPEPISPDLARDKEIVMVIDTSGSMGWNVDLSKYYNSVTNPKRITAARTAAENFREKFEEYTNVKIALVEYNSNASVLNDFLLASSNTLKNNISNLDDGGATNIGDGIRKGYYLFENSSETDVDRYMIFMTDGVANRRSRYSVPGSSNDYDVYDEGSSFDSFIKDGTSSSVLYAKNWAKLLNKDGAIDVYDSSNSIALNNYKVNDDMYINTYFIAFSAEASDLQKIAYEKDAANNYTVPVVDGQKFKQANTVAALEEYYSDLADTIIDSISIPVNFSDTFDANINIASVTDADLEGITTSEITIDNNVVSSVPDGWPVTYTYNETSEMLEAPPVVMKLTISINESGFYTLGSEDESYITYLDSDGNSVTKTFPVVTYAAHEVNPPIINMKQDTDSADSYFTLSYTGLANMHFGGNDESDYITFDHGFTDDLFGETNDEWTIRAVIEPTSLDTNKTNHDVSNVFIAKASDSKNDNLEVGIDAITGNLLLYIDTDYVDEKAISIGNGELTIDQQHDVVISYDHGMVYVTLDGNEYAVTDFVGTDNKMDDATGADFTLGGSLHKDKFFNGKINEVTLFDKAYTSEELVKEEVDSANVVASWHAKDSSAIQLIDSSGNGRHSTDISGTYLQSDLPGAIQLQYRIGPDPAPWVDYNDVPVLALATPGEVVVYARAVYTSDDYPDTISAVVEKTAKKADNMYIKNITMSSSDTNITVDDNYTMTYSLVGDEMTMAGETASTLYLNEVKVTFSYPSTTSVVSLPTGYSYDGTTVTGTITNAQMTKISDERYRLDTIDIPVVFEPDSTSDIKFPALSAEAEYLDFYNHTVTIIDGAEKELNVIPRQPTVMVQDGSDNVIDQLEAVDIRINGTAYPGSTVYLSITEGTHTIDGTTNSELKVVVASDGTYETTAVDFSVLDFGVSIVVTATVYDNDSPKDKNEGTDTTEKRVMLPDLVIK